jgi:hypothetical protein
MVAVNAELGRYFGVTEGVLVADITAESTPYPTHVSRSSDDD